MPKNKSHRATAKRRITRNGKVLHRKATGNHMLTKKSSSRRRRVEGGRGRLEGRRQDREAAAGGVIDGAYQAFGAREEERREILEPPRATGEPAQAAPRGQGTGHALRHVRLSRPPGPQGTVPPPLDHTHQRGGPSSRALVLPLRERAARAGVEVDRRSSPTWRSVTRGLRAARRDREGVGSLRLLAGRWGRVRSACEGCASRRVDVRQEPEGRRRRSVEEASPPRGGSSLPRRGRAGGGRSTGRRRTPRVAVRGGRTRSVAVRAKQAGVIVDHVTDRVMERLTSTVTPQGVVGIAPFVDVTLDALSPPGAVALLHEVRDPATRARSSVRQMLRAPPASCSRAARWTRTTPRASGHRPARSSTSRWCGTSRRRARSRPFGIEGSPSSPWISTARRTCSKRDPPSPAFVFGNEARGLPAEILSTAERRVRVPHAGRAESLNLAAAATVCLFEWVRRADATPETLEALVAAAAHDIRCR